MIDLALTLFVLLSSTAWVAWSMVRYAQKSIAKGRKATWPLFTYLWGVIITLPFGIISQLSRLTAQDETLGILTPSIASLVVPFGLVHLSSPFLVPLALILMASKTRSQDMLDNLKAKKS